MSLKLQIEVAKDAVSKALITALEEKNEGAISELFTVYNKLNTVPTTKTSLDINKFTINTNNIPSSYFNTDSINFGVKGSMSSDVISFS